MKGLMCFGVFLLLLLTSCKSSLFESAYITENYILNQYEYSLVLGDEYTFPSEVEIDLGSDGYFKLVPAGEDINARIDLLLPREVLENPGPNVPSINYNGYDLREIYIDESLSMLISDFIEGEPVRYIGFYLKLPVLGQDFIGLHKRYTFSCCSMDLSRAWITGPSPSAGSAVGGIYSIFMAYDLYHINHERVDISSPIAVVRGRLTDEENLGSIELESKHRKILKSHGYLK